MTIKHKYEMAADHIVVETQEDDDFYVDLHLRRVFNFRSQQVTTMTFFPRGGDAGAAMSSMIENFRDIEGQDDIQAAREELVKLGGNPPEYKPAARKTGKLKLD